MQIWTTPQFKDLLSATDVPLKILPMDEVKQAYLSGAAPGDIAVIAFDEQYLPFLIRAKEEGISGPIFLISSESTILDHDILRYNAILLDLKKLGLAQVKNSIHFYLKLLVQHACSPAADIIMDKLPEHIAASQPIADPPTIQAILNHIQSKALPVIVAFNILELGNSVTARGICHIKDITNGTMGLDRFRQSLLLKGLKKGLEIKVFFTYRQRDLYAIAKVEETGDKGIRFNVPDKLFPTKELRIQPNRKKPIGLYILVPNEPTKNLEVVDISSRGIGFLCSRELALNNAYGFTIMLPEPQAIIVTPGIIRYTKETDNGIRYGAEIHPHPWDAEAIAKYFMQREAEIIGLLRIL